jgi:hypothetical protein
MRRFGFTIFISKQVKDFATLEIKLLEITGIVQIKGIVIEI